MLNTRGFTLLELLLVVAIIGVITSIAVPGLLRARIRSNEVAATASLDAVTVSQAQFFDQCGGYASTLQDLVAKDFLSPDLTPNGTVKSGYRFTLVPEAEAIQITSTCGDLVGPVVNRYVVTADPVTPGTTGGKFFAMNVRGKYESTAVIPNPIPPNTPPVTQ